MRLIKARGSMAVGLAAALVGAVGCGGGGNDQGIVFRANGIFRAIENIDATTITCTLPLSTTNAIVDASFNLSLSRVTSFPDRDNAFANPCGGFLSLQNELSQQSLNVQEIVIRYEVAGASVAVPGNSVSFGQRILPASSDAETPSGQANLLFAELIGQIVPANIMVFLNQNVDRLPATPYLMNVFLVARGQSDDGEQYTTNEIGYQLTVVP